MTSGADPHLLTIAAPDRARVPSLDGLRAISISIVLAHHFISPLPGMPEIPGLFGVDIFFAISGFLIARLLLVEWAETGRLSLAHFYLRRALRLTPALLAFVAAITAFGLAVGPFDLRASACAVFYVTNYCVSEVGVMYAGNGVFLESTWSLAVEEQFYLFFPLLLVTLVRRDLHALYVAVASFCAAALAFRLAYAWLDKPEIFLAWRSETSLDMLMGGCALSIMSANAAGRDALRRIARSGVLALATAAYAASLFAWQFGKSGIAISQTALAFWLPVLIANVLFNEELPGLRALLNRPLLIWLGKISYSLYLWHCFVSFVGQHFGLIGDMFGAIVAIVASLALAHASWRWIEQPILNRRRNIADWLGVGARMRPAPAE